MTNRRWSLTRNALWPCAALVGLVLAVYWPLLTYGFLAWDDPYTVTRNRYYNPPTLAALGEIWGDFTLWFYVPVTYTVWWLLALVAYAPQSASPDGALVSAASLAPLPFHAANLVAHAAGVLLLFALLRRLGAGRIAAWFGAAVFAIHPIQVEAVAWVSSLYTSLSTTFALLAVLLYFRFSDRQITPFPGEGGNRGGNVDDGRAVGVLEYERPKPSPRVKYGAAYAFATLCFALSLLTKPSLATLPVIVAALEIGARGRRRAWQLWPLAPWVLLAAAATLVTREAQHAWDVHAPFWLRPFVAADAVAFYLWKFFVPLHFTPVYGRTPTWLEQSGWVVRLTWIVPALLVVATMYYGRRACWALTALIIFLATLAPNLGLVTFGFQRYSTVADRYFYPAMAVMAWLIAAALDRFKSKGAIAAAIVLVLTLAAASSLQVRKWKDTQSLFGNPTGPDMRNVMSAPGMGTSTE